MYFSSLTFLPHAPPISFCVNLSPSWYLAGITNNEGAVYSVVSSLLPVSLSGSGILQHPIIEYLQPLFFPQRDRRRGWEAGVFRQSMDWINLPQDMIKWRTFVNMVYLLTSRRTIGFWRRILLEVGSEFVVLSEINCVITSFFSPRAIFEEIC